MKSNVQKILRSARAGMSPAFIVILILSLGLWFVNELGRVYTTGAVIPVRVVDAADGSTGVIGGRYDVQCVIEGEGFELLKYKWSSGRDEEQVDVGRLDLQPVDGRGRSVISNISMLNALASQIKDVKVLSVSTPRMEVVTAEIRSKTVPVVSRISVDYDRRYQQVGGMELVPDSVEVRSLEVLLDTLKAVYTEPLVFNGVSGSLSGTVALTPVEGVVLPVRSAAYSVAAEEFTEIERTLPIEVANAPADMVPVVMPQQVRLRLNVAMSRLSDGSLDAIRAYIDYDDSKTNIDKYFKVYIDCTAGINIYSVDPVYAELIFERVR